MRIFSCHLTPYIVSISNNTFCLRMSYMLQVTLEHSWKNLNRKLSTTLVLESGSIVNRLSHTYLCWETGYL